MNKENLELLDEVAADRLSTALNGANEDERSKAFEESMKAMALSAEIAKQDDSYQEHAEKLAAEKEKRDAELELQRQQIEDAKKDKRKTYWLRALEIGFVAFGAIGVPLINEGRNRKFKAEFAERCIEFEQNGNMFTTTPGRSTRDYFRHK